LNARTLRVVVVVLAVLCAVQGGALTALATAALRGALYGARVR